jgi:hypothetical protein
LTWSVNKELLVQILCEFLLSKKGFFVREKMVFVRGHIYEVSDGAVLMISSGVCKVTILNV